MSRGYAITARALDANSPRSSFETLLPCLQRKIDVIERDGVIWTGRRGPYGGFLLCFGAYSGLPVIRQEVQSCPLVDGQVRKRTARRKDQVLLALAFNLLRVIFMVEELHDPLLQLYVG
jgi:hypothetical protein